MKKAKDDLANKNFYSNLLDKYGDDFRSLNWGSENSQNKRFEALASIANLQNTSILDVGCGLSHFYEWLKNKKIDVEYHGIDITSDMINRSKKKFPDVIFSIGTIFDETQASARQYEYVFASGIFYLRSGNPKEYMERTIEKMFELAKNGVAFNSLSTWSDNMETGEFYADPMETISFCKDLSKKIVLQHHYHSADFTIIIYK